TVPGCAAARSCLPKVTSRVAAAACCPACPACHHVATSRADLAQPSPVPPPVAVKTPYAIKQAVVERTDGRLSLGPGTLYEAIDARVGLARGGPHAGAQARVPDHPAGAPRAPGRARSAGGDRRLRSGCRSAGGGRV